MDLLISQAHAQDAGSAIATGFVVHWPFLLLAVALAGFAVAIIWNNKEVSTGHIAILGAAVAVALVPYIANFEWTNEGFKFTTRDESAAIAGQVSGLLKQNTDLRDNLKSTQEALLAVSERLKSVESRATGSNNAPAFPSRNVPELPNAAQLRSLIEENDAAIAGNQSTLETLNRLEGQLASPAAR